MVIRFLTVTLCVLMVGACQDATSGSGSPVTPTPAPTQAATNPSAVAGAAADAPQAAQDRERPWKARLVWSITNTQWAGEPGQATSTFGGRCSVPSDYVVSATFEGQATHAGRVTGTTEHCSQVIWSEQGPAGATYTDGLGVFVAADRSTISLAYGNGTTGYDPATGELWFHDTWTFTGGTGRFAGVTGSGEEGGRFLDFGAILVGAPVSMWMEGTMVYNPRGN